MHPQGGLSSFAQQVWVLSYPPGPSLHHYRVIAARWPRSNPVSYYLVIARDSSCNVSALLLSC